MSTNPARTGRRSTSLLLHANSITLFRGARITLVTFEAFEGTDPKYPPTTVGGIKVVLGVGL